MFLLTQIWMGVLVLSNWILLRIKLVLAFIIPIMASVYAVIPLIITIYGLIVAALMFFIKIVIACIVLLFRLLILRMTFSKLILNIVLLETFPPVPWETIIPS